MIYDNISNILLYKNLNKEIYNVLKVLRDLDAKEIPNGTVNINDNIILNIIQFETSFDNKDFEAHKNHIDIFYILSGCENIKITNREKCEVIFEYDYEKDIEILRGDELGNINLFEGMFLVCFPDDVHKPGLSVLKNQMVKKAVMKVKIVKE